MAASGISPISVSLEDYSGSGKVATPALLAAMLRAAEKISDLIFSPGRPPQVQVYGQLIPVHVEGLASLTADDTRHIAAGLDRRQQTGRRNSSRTRIVRHFLWLSRAWLASGSIFSSSAAVVPW